MILAWEILLMKTNSILQPIAVNDEVLARKVEFVILSLLTHYNCYYQDSLLRWYSALRLGIPQLTDLNQIEDAFKRLSAGGIIELDRPITGSCDGGSKPFMTTLTPMGVSHWNSVRIHR
jgi:hypothetical protein